MITRRYLFGSTLALAALTAGRALTAGNKTAETVTDAELVAALGSYWPEPELRRLLAVFGISGEPRVRDDYSGFLQNRPRGIELTFRPPGWLDVPLRTYPNNAVVLSNIRFYGKPTRTHAAYTGKLPFGLRPGMTRDSLIERLGPADIDVAERRLLRWDRERYAFFAKLSEQDDLSQVSLQTPVVRSTRPGF